MKDVIRVLIAIGAAVGVELATLALALPHATADSVLFVIFGALVLAGGVFTGLCYLFGFMSDD